MKSRARLDSSGHQPRTVNEDQSQPRGGGEHGVKVNFFPSDGPVESVGAGGDLGICVQFARSIGLARLEFHKVFESLCGELGKASSGQS